MKHPWDILNVQPKPAMVARRHDIVQIWRWVQETFDHWYADMENDAQSGQCVHWTHAGCCILRLCGYRAILQAGTMRWPMAPDRGTNATHFAYEWHPKNLTTPKVVNEGYMPELHCWIACPDENLIIDFSTGRFKNAATNCHGFSWELSDPPPFLWAEADKLPPGVVYWADVEAIRYLFARLNADAERQKETA